MTYTTPTVNYSATINGTYTSLTGIQSVSINRGRQRFQDNFAQTNCVIELIPANSYTVPLVVGQFIDVRDTNSASSPCYFAGIITDINRRFDMPFDAVSGAAPGDRITITATGPIGAVGANSADITYAAGTAIFRAAGVCFFSGVDAFPTYVGTVLTPAINYNGGALDLVNSLLRTGQIFIDELDTKRLVTPSGFSFYVQLYNAGLGNRNYVFSDAGTVGAFEFAALEYLSSVQNAFTEIEVTAPGVATQTASVGARPFNTLVYNTNSDTAAAALDLANYVLALQNDVAITPFSVSTSTVLSPTCTTLSLINVITFSPPAIASPGANLGSAVTVEFRGTTVTGQIQGINTTFYPDQARVQLYLSPSLGAPFTLDNTSFGVLDANKLGY
jgi:hypothetical protein